ncbi:MAG TPA: hypothetical protein VKA64_01465 [Gammaproteobacteria bacterium]|nr:hypothetical protein [Gammaproteobacteria bacterium]
MFEYMFFDEGLRKKFVAFARERDVDVQSKDDETGCIAEVPEDVEDEVADAIDDYYEQLLQETADIMEEGDGLEKSAAAVQVSLADGTKSNIMFDPDLMARLLNCITIEELRDMVQDIAHGVENPDDRPICKR